MEIIKKYGFNFSEILIEEIRKLIEEEIADFQEGSSEYIILLCGYLYCIGDVSDATLIEKAKYSINMDVGCMIDGEWIDSLKGIENESLKNIIFNNSRNFSIHPMQQLHFLKYFEKRVVEQHHL